MGLPVDDVDEICSSAAEAETLAIANYNGSGQLVVSGHAAAVGRAEELATARGAVTRRLTVSAPFHCELMEPAAVQLAAHLAKMEFQPPGIPVVECESGTIVRSTAGLGDRIGRQVRAPVRWDKVMDTLTALSVGTAVEVGVGKRLSSLLRREQCVAHTMSCALPEDVTELARMAVHRPLLQRPLGYWQMNDRGHSVNIEDLLVVWAGSETAEKVDTTGWIAGDGGAWMRRYGTMARLSAQGELEVLDSDQWFAREDGAYLRRDGSCIIKPDGEIEAFVAEEWLVSAAGTMRKTDGTRIIWSDGQEWSFDDH
jgi:[acyl-carrier-protein] S-malonyltransferase